MKNFYMILMCIAFIEIPPYVFGQAIQLDDNHNLSGVPFNGKLLLTSDRDSTFWTSDGTAVGTMQMSTVKSDLNGYTILNNKVYFAGLNAANGSELWSTDGTGVGTVLVSDIWSGPDSSKPADFVNFNNKVYFTAYTPALGRELYEYTGSGSPVSVTDFNPGAGNSFDNPFFASLNNVLYFNATNNTGNAVYALQGSTFTKILDLPTGFSINGYSHIGNTIFFSIGSTSSGMKIYSTIGTASATLVKDFSNPFAGFFPPQLMNWNNKIYFVAAETGVDSELWSTDGSSTSMVADINTGSEGSSPIIVNSVVLQNKLVFAATTDASGMELWTTDGTASGTTMLKDINTNPGDGSDPILWPAWSADINKLASNDYGIEYFNRTTNYNGYIFFSANDGTGGVELYKTDGTTVGTVLVKDINTSGDGVGDSYLYTTSGVVFSGNDGTNGFEPWISDGSISGTQPIVNINLSGDSDPDFYFIWKGDIYLNADNGNGGVDGYYDFYKLQGPYSPLPVTLSGLVATVYPENVLLNWSTSSENNSDHFEVLRSKDGEHFENIGSVAAAGQSNTTKKYSFVDNDAYNQGVNKLYYRLNMKDRDGRSYLSKVVNATLNDLPVTMSIYPNPASDLLKVKYNAAEGGTISIVDINGKVFHRTTVSPSTVGMKQINISTFPPGAYLLKFSQGRKVTIQKFVKQ